MKKDIKELAVSFLAFRFVGEHSCPIVADEPSVKKSDADQLLDVIYAPDSFTRLPQSDVAVYLSDKVDPAIREFVASQLLSPHPETTGVSDDESDLLFELIRGEDESVADYAVRVNGIIASDNDIRIKESEVNDVKSE